MGKPETYKTIMNLRNCWIFYMTDQTVTYLVKDYRNGRRYIPHTIKGIDFLRMFLMHVLPKGLVRIRHYGLLSCRNKKEKMKLCRKLLNFISSVWENLNSYPIPFSIHTTSNFPILWIVHTIDFRYMKKKKYTIGRAKFSSNSSDRLFIFYHILEIYSWPTTN